MSEDQAAESLKERVQTIETADLPKNYDRSYRDWILTDARTLQLSKLAATTLACHSPFCATDLQEEQEKHLAPEMELEPQVERPPRVEPAAHSVHPELVEFIAAGGIILFARNSLNLLCAG